MLGSKIYHDICYGKGSHLEPNGDHEHEGQVVLGVIRLDYDYPTTPGDVDDPRSFNYKVIFRVVPGLTYEICKSGTMPEDVKEEFVEGIKYLEGRGVAAVTGDCGFMMWFQDLARNTTHLPVFMSSLTLLPTIVSAYSKRDQVIVMTANGEKLDPMRNLIAKECGMSFSQDNIVILGAQDIPGFEAVAEGKRVNTVKVEPGIVAAAKQAIAEHPRAKAFLIECTEIPHYSNAIRHETGLPVFDVITACDFFISSRRCEARFGRQGWQLPWDGVRSEYRYGQNLTPKQKMKLVNKAE